jgi:cobalt/nickel transport system permease protein
VQHSFIDRYSRLASPVHALPVQVKTIAMMLFLVIIAIASPFSPVLVFGIAPALIVIALLSRIPAGFLLKRLVVLGFVAAGISVLSLLRQGGERLVAGLMLKSGLSLFTIVLFANTTPFTTLLDVLRSWKIPPLFITVLALMYRYLFVLVDETERMQRARTSRTFSARRVDHWRARATVISQLFVRSLERAERIFAAMSARGWR